MKEMIKCVREEKGGFTLAELLIVVAILLVLIAIAVPLFTGALGRAENAVANANQRSAVSEAKVDYQLNGRSANATYYYYYDGNGNELPGSGLAGADGVVATAPSGTVYKYQVNVSTANNGDVTVDAEVEGNGKVS